MAESLKNELPQKVVRAFVVSLAKADEILNSIKEGRGFSCLRFYLGVKGNEKSSDDFKRQRRLTFFGGNIGEFENSEEAIQREVGEELSITGLGLPRFTEIGSWKYKIGHHEREIILVYMPVSCVPEDRMVIGDGKIIDFKTLTLSQLRQTIEEGIFDDLPIEEHLSMKADSSDIFSISSEDKDRRNGSLEKGLSWMEHIESYLQRKINSLIELCIDENGDFDEEKFKKEYEKLRSYFMRRGLEVNKKRRNEKKEEEKKHPLLEVLTSGFLGKEILYYLPELAMNGVNWSGLEEAPEGVKIFVNFLKDSLEEFLKSSIKLPNGEEITFSSPEEFGSFLKRERVLDVTEVMNKFDFFFTKKLREIFGVSDERIQDVKSKVNGFLRELIQEIKTSEGLYQAYTLVNEVQNASLGRLALLFLGFDIKKNTSYAEPIIRFEAGRQLLLNLKSLSLIERFYNINEAIQHGVFQSVFERFFNSIEGEILADVGEGRKIRVKYRKGGIIYDEKPTKSFTSYLRKSFEEKPEEIVDFCNINVIPLNDEIADPVDYIQKFILSITDSIRNELGQQLKVSKIKFYGTRDYKDAKSVIIDGKRQGSQGSRLVRGKVIMKFGSEVLELVIYPYFSLKDDEKGYWGWVEKIEDDTYYAKRRLLTGENGLPSFYDLLFPSSLYPLHYKDKLGLGYQK